MDPILIPHEGNNEKKNKKKPTKKISNKETHNLLIEIRKKLEAGIANRDQKIISKTCIKMLEFLDPEEDHSLEKVNDLLRSLQRSSISIQRKKKKIVEETNEKMNQKNRKRRK